MTVQYTTERKYKLVVLAPLNVIIPNLESLESELLELLEDFNELTGQGITYDVVTPIEFLIIEILQNPDLENSSLRSMELDAGYIYSELSTMIWQDIDDELPMQTGDFTDAIDNLTEVFLPIALNFWHYIRKANAISDDHVSNISEVIVHDLEEACVIQYLTHQIRKKE